MKTLLTITLAVLCSLATARAATLSGPIINPGNGHTYFLLSQNTWTSSEAEALTLGGHLATINDLTENQWVFNTFTPLAGTPNASLWIGFNDAAVEGQFVWSSGEAVAFTSWFPGEPNNTGGIEDYATMRPPSASPPFGSWNDQPNTATAGSPDFPILGVVEVVPEPSTYALCSLGGLVILAFRRLR